MLNIKILGPGCFNCLAVEEAVVLGLERLSEQYPDLEVTLEHVQDRDEIFRYPIFFTPGLVINEKLVCGGRIPEEAEVITWLANALEETS